MANIFVYQIKKRFNHRKYKCDRIFFIPAYLAVHITPSLLLGQLCFKWSLLPSFIPVHQGLGKFMLTTSFKYSDNLHLYIHIFL
jgi:hypothetical protein